MARPSLNDDAKTYFAALRKNRAAIGNLSFREQLGWREERYERAKEFLIESGKIIRGRGRGGSVSIAT
jgi:type I restriction enzyme M protein